MLIRSLIMAERRLRQSTIPFVNVSSASRRSSSTPPEDSTSVSTAMVLGHCEDRSAAMDPGCCEDREEPTSLLGIAIGRTRILTDEEKYELLTTLQESRINDDDFDVQLYKIDGGRKTKRTKFQRSWLRRYNWLRHGLDSPQRGGWCLVCILPISSCVH